MDSLYLCAAAYSSLLKYEYICTVGRKNTSYNLIFSFSPYAFKHLAGLHKIPYQKLRSNSQRILRDILSSKITLETLKRAPDWGQYKEALDSRISALTNLEYVMDNFEDIFWFSQAIANANGLNTRLPDGYLIKFPLADGRIFYFTIQSEHTWTGDSIFINDLKDYSAAQCRYTLLKKVKRNVLTGCEECLYISKNYRYFNNK